MPDPKRPIIVALDLPAAAPALELARRLDPARCRLKVGQELFTRAGPEVVTQLHALGFEIFLDLKFHDIPNTVAAACDAAADLGVWMCNLHIQGGRAMIAAARERLAGRTQRPLLIGVTLLTSLGAAELAALGCPDSPADQVLRLARLGRQGGLDGFVCSPREAALLRGVGGPGMILVTPGIRPPGAAHHDQQRVLTPGEALAAGADYLVIGRPIVAAADPRAALDHLLATLPAPAD